MELFQKVNDAYVIAQKGGVFCQFDVYTWKGFCFAELSKGRYTRITRRGLGVPGWTVEGLDMGAGWGAVRYGAHDRLTAP